MAVTGRAGPPGSKEYDGQEYEFTGRVKQIDHKDHNTILHIKNTYLSDGTDLNGSVLMYIPDQEEITEELHIGMKITARGEFNEFARAHNRGQFDLSRHYALKGYSYAVYKGSVIAGTAGYDRIADGLYRIKKRTEAVYEHYLDGTDRGVLEALTLADKGSLDKDLKDRYSDAGIAHILALSGLHIATVGFLLVNLLKKLRLPLWLAAFISTGLMLCYCIMTGMPVSAQRALIMYLLAIGAMLLKRSVDLRTSAAIAALIMLTINPDRLYDASFIMSFSSILGIGLVYPYIRDLVLNVLGRSRVRILKRSEKVLVRIGMGILSSIVLSISIQLAMIPFTMWFYFKIPVYGILINLIVVPLAGVLLMLSIAVAILGSLVLYAGGACSLLDLPVRFLSFLTHLILSFYDLLTRGVNRIPGTVLVTGRPAAWQMVLYYLILAGTVAYAAYLSYKEKVLKGKIRRRRMAGYKDLSNKLPQYLRDRSGFAILNLTVSFILIFVRIEPAFEISALYVGQGECFVIHGRDVPTIMYDCGSTDEKKVGEYTVEPFLECLRLSRIDTVFISHLDTDHVSGLIQMLSDENSHIRIGRILISGDPAQKESDNYESLMAFADSRNIPVYPMCAGDRMSWKNISIECLWPEESSGVNKDSGGEEITASSDLNDGSLVLSLEYIKGYRALFTGDISSRVEDLLIPGLSEYDLLQAAHHGSASAANETFIRAVSPKRCIISAGIDNRYGHPHKETMDILKSQGIETFVTSECGEIDVRP